MASDDITLFAMIAVVAVPVFAVSARIVIRATTDAMLRVRAASRPAPALELPPPSAALEAEVEELRAQVERMAAAEAFYAQLQAPSPAKAATTA